MFDRSSVAIYSILGPEEASAMAEIVERAFRVLKDPIDRRKYDKELDAAAPQMQVAEAGAPSEAPLQRSFFFHGPVYAVEPVDGPPESPGPSEGRRVTDIPVYIEEQVEAEPELSEVPPLEAAEPATEAAGAIPSAGLEAGPVPHDERTGEKDSSAGREEGGAAALQAAITTVEEPDNNQVIGDVWFERSQAAEKPAKPAQAQPAAVQRHQAEPAVQEPVPREPTPIPAPSAQIDDEINTGPDTIFSGTVLKRIREKQGLDLGDIASITRITRTNLQLIENEAYKDLPAPVYVRGYLTQYAKCLRLDPRQVANTYMERMKKVWNPE
jgi:hypothetical protein